MGTAVLFPQDCLRPRSRHKHQISGMIYPSDCAPVSERNPLPLVQSQEDGLLPLPGQGRHSLPMNVPRRGGSANHFKCRKNTEQKDIDHSSRFVSDTPVYRILQRPKQGDTAVDVLTQFVMLDNVTRSVTVGEKTSSTKGSRNDGVDKCKDSIKAEYWTPDIKSDGSKYRGRSLDVKTVKVRQRVASGSETKYVSKLLSGVHASFVEGYKLPRAKMGVVKPKNTSLDKVHVGPIESVGASPPPVAPKPFSTNATTGKVMDVSGKVAIVQPFEGSHSLVPRLRRTSTEPQISTTHILGQYKSKVIHSSLDKSKSESDAHRLGLYVNTSSMSCQERWAGPAYTASPSPSSLPLPKLCLPQTRFSSLEIPPLSKQFSSSVYMQPFLGSSASSEMGGAWDVTFATKNLRKMLNLDPC